MPKLTTEFWAHEQQKDSNKKLDAELDEHFDKKEVKTANQNLGEDMQIDEGESMRSHANKAVQRAIGKEVSNRKKEARKKSSGGAANQESQPTNNGRKQPKKSRKKQGKQPKRHEKRYHEDSEDDESSYDSRHRHSRHRSEERDSHRRRGKERGRPKSILRNNERSVSFGRSTTPEPARSRYSSRKSTHRRRGTNYRYGEREDRDEDRGGYRGGRNGGRGRRN
jgi:hypothetical protein